MKKINNFLISLSVILLVLPAPVFAQQLQKLESDLNNAAQQTDPNQMPAQLYVAIATYIRERVFSLLIGVAIAMAILFIMYGSFQYFTAYGDENRATNAKKTITYAFIGLLIAFMAMGIAGLVQQSIVSNEILNVNQIQVH